MQSKLFLSEAPHCCDGVAARVMMLLMLIWKVRDKKRKEKATLLSVVKEKLMVNLSFPSAKANTKGGEGLKVRDKPQALEAHSPHTRMRCPAHSGQPMLCWQLTTPDKCVRRRIIRQSSVM